MSNFFYGMIEGFYGRQWSWESRTNYRDFLEQYGFDCYLYAPKGDPYLRTRWRELYPSEYFSELKALRTSYSHPAVRWGLGLSPLGLNEGMSLSDEFKLQAKIEQINELSPDILCILFDDTKGDIDGLAKNQLSITDHVMSLSNAKHFIVCPTYYSFDPKLEDVFGIMPKGYLQDLGMSLPSDVGFFWTGNKVISERFIESDIDRIASIIQRKPILWDNYPVNDGKITSNYLNLSPYQNRPSDLSDWVQGHIVNPMNQAYLSRTVLASLTDVYQLKSKYQLNTAWQKALKVVSNDKLANYIYEDATLFQTKGLKEIKEQEKHYLIERYNDFENPVAKEIVDWLRGGYEFDPDCLTG